MPNREQRRNAQKQGDDLVLKLYLDGNRYEIDVLEFTALDEDDFAEKTGLGFMQLGEMFQGGAASLRLKPIVALLWIHRRRSEPNLTYEQVAGSITLRDLAGAFALDDVAAPAEAAAPVPE